MANIPMNGVPGTMYQPGDSSVQYLANPSGGAIANVATGVSGVEPEHVRNMLASGAVLATSTTAWE